MIIKIDTENLDDVKKAMVVLATLLEPNQCRSGKCQESAEAKPTKKKTAKKVKEDEPQLEIEDDESIFDDDDDGDGGETELTEADVKKALNECAKKNGQTKALKILKQYSTTGKLSGVAKEDYAALVADLI